ncbi:RidA family protein [Phytoactinopolyspora limicola]|uniref:RidA family protein n=1 Tax=Phytoactinopolyspora limicola TaxID=2715536 RepID=UPI0014079C69|nr:RidA family protein [Phytoactinopolyspora limicola]
MTHTIINPSSLHDPVGFGYSHLAVGNGLVLVAGQYASDSQGAVTSADFGEQVERAFENLRAALGAVDLDLSHVAQLRTFIVDHNPDKLAALTGRISQIWGQRPPAQTLLGVAALALPGMLFEVDALAFRE